MPAALFGLAAMLSALAWISCTYDVPDVVPQRIGPPCKPTTCAAASAECGKVPDGCGGVLECGSCAAGALCGGNGAYKCGNNGCQVAACGWQNCGLISNGCDNVIDCGGCGASRTCGATEANKCGCVPRKCAAVGAECGMLADGCGGVINCGKCEAGVCFDNRCAAGSCQKKTCSQQGATCGQVGDGCEGSITCGACTAPDFCGGNGKANQCGCPMKPCCVPDGKQTDPSLPCCSGQSQGSTCGCKPDGQPCTAPGECCGGMCNATSKTCESPSQG